jgi:hypothetical protein
MQKKSMSSETSKKAECACLGDTHVNESFLHMLTEYQTINKQKHIRWRLTTELREQDVKADKQGHLVHGGADHRVANGFANGHRFTW